jgi:polar amino acid transport system substrate-binding protein
LRYNSILPRIYNHFLWSYTTTLKQFILLVLICGGWLVGSQHSIYADQLDDIYASGVLLWGGDKEGGGPYILIDDSDSDNDEKLRGFEVELAKLIATELGRAANPPRTITPRFKQGQWEQVPELVKKKDIHLALNGFESTPTNQRDYRCSRPYYQYGLQLLAAKNTNIHSWDDLKQPRPAKLKVGVLGESAAQRFIEQELTATLDQTQIVPWSEFMEVQVFDGNTDALDKVEKGELDLTFLDDCAALYYAERYPNVNFVGRPVGQGTFVMLMHSDESRLQTAINAALEKLIESGELGQLYDRWQLGGKQQTLALRNPNEVRAAPKLNSWEVISNSAGTLLKAAGYTVLLACASMPLAIAIGVLVALGRLYGPWPVKYLGTCYVELIRGTPLMLQLFAIYFLLPSILPFEIKPIYAGILGLAINYSAYEAEIYRAGLQAIPRGQLEAALALGMSRAQAIRRVILPQAFRIVIPPVTNDFIALFKDTSVCSVITIVELTKQYAILSRSTGAIVELAILTSLLYLLMSYPLSVLTRWSEKKLQGK